MMHWHFFSLRIAALVVLAAVVVGTIDLALRGFVVLHDPDGVVATAAIGNGDETRDMRAFARGYWATRPTLEGSVRVRCRSGAELRLGYVTPGARTAVTVRDPDCRR